MKTTTPDPRLEAAVRAFWSSHPLNLEFRKHREQFSLEEFISFVKELPSDQFDACMTTAQVRR